MSNDPTTCDDEKTVHQQCTTMTIEDALQLPSNVADGLDPDDAIEALPVFAAEVRRLREDVREWDASSRRLSAASRDLRAKLARVEALPAQWRSTSGDRSRAWECAENLEAALRDDPQPSAAPTPKGEPYNGW